MSVCDSMNYIMEPEDLKKVFGLVKEYLAAVSYTHLTRILSCIGNRTEILEYEDRGILQFEGLCIDKYKRCLLYTSMFAII